MRDDPLLFEALTLEGAQAGLSWLTVLRKRENYRKAFDFFDPVRVSAYGEEDVQRLLGNPGIIRNQLKIRSSITNARAFRQIQEEFGGFAKFLWGFVEDRPLENSWQHMREVPATSPESDRLSEELRRRGFKFAGSTICYAVMQAVGWSTITQRTALATTKWRRWLLDLAGGRSLPLEKLLELFFQAPGVNS